ncbi:MULTISPECIES: hypothetical protein [Pseudoalteromonas]|jgi:hypothetical protein|uniref:hypothetical protein n=1 Tax=Pseudoalteromonas TaxID=53246 RepID=UPI000CBDD75E|nr:MULTISPECIES: hypothetical protein [Pseudoalteromonas]MBZ2191609.1 hypothetical protein [Pseudoalteromonas arctica]PLT24180.1 hypothetical protein CXF89_16915 [Pseudoalteromonas sp. MelDa3]|tara:strand:+ start:144 stop:518 length:375 start_codon:yes stop_codon:yes gene_type:complete
MRLILLLSIFLVVGCSIGNRPWADYQNDKVGHKAPFLDPTRYGDTGDLIRADYLISGDGFTHTSKNKDGYIIQHWFISEVLSTAPNKDWVGKCKVFYVVDPQTNIIVSWDYDKGANPESCRVWL